MVRHRPAHLRRSPLSSPVAVLGAGALALLLVAGGAVWWATADDGGCDTRRTVHLAVAPELEQVASRLLRTPLELTGGECAVAEVTAQRPLQTVGDLGALDDAVLPQVWVPDSSLWTARVADVPLDTSGSFAVSPVVLATSRSAAAELGWDAKAPSWRAALAGDRPVARPDQATSAQGLVALAAVRSSLGDGADADNAVVAAVLAAARGKAPAPEDALTAAAEDAADAPLAPVSERQVLQANAEDGAAVAVYPAEGSPVLDYPVVRVGDPGDDLRPAVDAVVRAMTSKAARDAARKAGFRGPDGSAPAGAGDTTGTREEAPERLDVDPAAAQDLLARLAGLQTPSRLLAVFDVSTSMEEPVGDGTRATLARDAAKSALGLFPAKTAIGLWFFAVELDGTKDWKPVAPMRTLDADVDGGTQAELLAEKLDGLPSRLKPGGTALYDTTLAAVRAARGDYDADAVNSVVIVTDGRQDDDDGLTLDQLLTRLRDETDPDRPVKVIGIALGPDADLAALEQIADAAGGAAYSAVEEEDLQTVLFDALRQRD
jgi:Ca-activated chloride channel family protein